MTSILKILEKYNSFLITTHVNPDPDALASELAMAFFLKARGKRVQIVNADAVKERLMFLPGAKVIKKVQQRHPEFDVAIAVDCGDLDRIGSVRKLLRKDHVILNIDHHVTNDRFGDVNLVIPGASSTAEVIFDLLKECRFPLKRDIAILLYVGIMTDTGSFRYDNASAKTHGVVSELLRFRFSVSELYRKLYESVPAQDLRYFTKIVNAFDSLYDGRVICLELKKNVVKTFSEEFDLRDKIFQLLRTIKGVEVVVILTEEGKNGTRVNLRSQGKVNVAKIAFHFQGGGHRKASGCLVPGKLEQAKHKILLEIGKAL